jgi:hypothetical protein
MKTLSKAKLLKLDLEVGTEVMGFKCKLTENMGGVMRCWKSEKGRDVPFEPTTNPADTMAVWERVLQIAKPETVRTHALSTKGFEVFSVSGPDASGATLKQTICKFALRLSRKPVEADVLDH